MIDKRGIEMSFAWLFAIIVGAIILFIAIYAAISFMNSGQGEVNTGTAKEISILLNPLETGAEIGVASSFALPLETRIYNNCNSQKGIFGMQGLSVSEKSFRKWTAPGLNLEFPNQYIFSDKYTEGKKFYLFAKPFGLPFKVANVVYLTSKNYCFYNVPEEIESELEPMSQENIKIEENCPENSINVCFGSVITSDIECEIKVMYNDGEGYVEKDNEILYFAGDSLMYGAIFSDKNTYECQLKRLMKKTEQLTLLYIEKANFVSQRGCNSNLDAELIILNSMAKNLEKSDEISQLTPVVENIQYKNEDAECRLF
ncbi:MAG: hypothetical protein KKA64_04890 [Nanoarchaeota archaeon]|nr:hypothetical protein [Nanoarchaeota archaeon]